MEMKSQKAERLFIVRPAALALFIHFPNAVKGHAMNPALRVCEPERLRVVFGEIHFSKRHDDDPALHGEGVDPSISTFCLPHPARPVHQQIRLRNNVLE